MTGILGALPPGLQGYVAADQERQGRQAQELGMLAQFMQMRGGMEDRDLRRQQLQAAQEEAKVKATQDAALRDARAGIFGASSPVPGILGQGAAMGDVGPTVGNAERLATAPPMSPMALNPEGVQRYLMQGGKPDDIEKIRNLGPRGALGKVDLDKFTPESITAFMQSDNPALLRPRVKSEIAANGVAYDPFALQPGTTFADPNKAFHVGPNGQPIPNLPFQQYDMRKAATGAARTNVTVNPMRETFKDEQALRGEYTDASKTYVKLAEGYSKVKGALASDPSKSAPATLAAATQFMKMLDPESVVRESELGMALSAAGAWDRFTNIYNTVQNGKVLTPNQAKEFGRIADVVYEASNRAQQGRVQHFQGLAKSYNFDPARVVPDLTPKPQRRSSDASAGWSVVR